MSGRTQKHLSINLSHIHMSSLEKIIVNTDGGSRGNPGPAAVGVVIQDSKGAIIKEYGEALGGHMTNNEAEYEAVIFALKKLKALYGKEKTQEMSVKFVVDSELIANQLTGTWRVEEERMQSLYMKVHNLKFDFKSVTIKAVPREKNTRADELLNQALDGKSGPLL